MLSKFMLKIITLEVDVNFFGMFTYETFFYIDYVDIVK